MGIKIGNTSWNIQQVLKHSKEDFISLPQHRNLVKGTEEKKDKDLSDVYSICKVQSKIFSNENGAANAEAGAAGEAAAAGSESGEQNTVGAGAGEPKPNAQRQKRRRNTDKPGVQANDDSDQKEERAGDQVGDAEG